MSDRINNRLAMVGACITTAELPEHVAVYHLHDPLDFETELNLLKAKYAAALGVKALADATPTGAADQKDGAETALEYAAWVLARATAIHLKRTGDLTRRAQVNYPLSGFQKLRDQDLIARCTTVRDIAQDVTGQPGAVGRGVTAARITALTNALSTYTALVNAPRGKIVNRTALLRELETQVAVLVDDAEDLDDLVAQFDGSEAGRRFGVAWNQARINLDAGHSPTPPTPPGPPPGP